MGFRRELLPVLFALIAMVLSTHQARATEQVPDRAVAMAVHMDAHDQQNVPHAVHSIGCCSLAIGLVAPGFEAVHYGARRTKFAIQVADLAVHSGFRSEHFRPPRLA